MGLVTHSAQGLPGVASCPRVDLPSRNRLCVISAVPCTCSVCARSCFFVPVMQSCCTAVWPSWFPVPHSPYSLCGRKATLEYQELCENRGGRPGLSVPNSTLYARSCFFVPVVQSCCTAVWPPSLIVLMVSVDVKRH